MFSFLEPKFQGEDRIIGNNNKRQINHGVYFKVIGALKKNHNGVERMKNSKGGERLWQC